MVDEEINIKHIDMKHIDMKHIDMKEKILNKLEGEFEVTKIERDYNSGEVDIICEFINNGKCGKFIYTLEGRERGIEEVRDYEEEDDEDIYRDIIKWVDENIEWSIIIKWGNKEIK